MSILQYFQQPKLYRNVVDEVIKNVREAFLNDGVDEQVLQELKQVNPSVFSLNIVAFVVVWKRHLRLCVENHFVQRLHK